MYQPNVLIAGHRGFGATDDDFSSAIARVKVKPPENTIPSIQAAIDAGVGMVEVDVMLTKDDQIVVCHSNKLDDHVFVTKKNGFIQDLTYDEIKQFKTGRHQQGTIPLLKDVFDVLLKNDVVLNIELKDVKGTDRKKRHTHVSSLVKAVLEEITAHFDHKRVIYSSFSEQDFRDLKEPYGDSQRAIAFKAPNGNESRIYPHDDSDPSCYLQCTEDNITRLYEEYKIAYIHPELSSVTPEAMSMIKEHGIGVNAWSSDEPLPKDNLPAIEHFLNLLSQFGMDGGIMTDYVVEMEEVVAGC